VPPRLTPDTLYPGDLIRVAAPRVERAVGRRMRLDADTRLRLSRARDRLEFLDASPTIAEVARGAGISPFHFIRLFEAAFGVTPHQYRVGVRIAEARRLLASGQSVTDVCLAVGFSSLGSFSATFARRVGQAPSVYQRHIRTVVQVPADLDRVFFPGCFTLLGRLPPDAFRNFGEAPPGPVVAT
jgi:AraC-like DNA-binding protein